MRRRNRKNETKSQILNSETTDFWRPLCCPGVPTSSHGFPTICPVLKNWISHETPTALWLDTLIHLFTSRSRCKECSVLDWNVSIHMFWGGTFNWSPVLGVRKEKQPLIKRRTFAEQCSIFTQATKFAEVAGSVAARKTLTGPDFIIVSPPSP